MKDYCRWCGRYTETLDLECEDCSKVSPFEHYHWDPVAEQGKQWRPVMDIRSGLL